MKLRTLVAATNVALIASLAPAAADAAPKRAYQVSIKVSRTQADVGQTIRIAGRVAGPKAAKKRLAVQRKVGHGKWRTIKKVRTTKRARYSTAVKVTAGGRQYFRVVAPKSSKRRAGVSRARALTGWRWLDLTTQPSMKPEGQGGVRGPVVVAGRTYPKALTYRFAADMFDVSGRCTTFTATAAVPDGETMPATLSTVVLKRFSGETEPKITTTPLTPGRAPVRIRADLTGQRVLMLHPSTNSPERATVIAPRVRCSINALPLLTMPRA